MKVGVVLAGAVKKLRAKDISDYKADQQAQAKVEAEKSKTSGNKIQDRQSETDVSTGGDSNSRYQPGLEIAKSINLDKFILVGNSKKKNINIKKIFATNKFYLSECRQNDPPSPPP